MNNYYWLGTATIIMGGIWNGCFALPMKFSRRWRWENTWLVFCFLALLVLPWVLVAGFVPHARELYRSAPASMLIYPLVFGFLWGIAQVTFGLSIKAIGIAVAFAVVQGLQTPIGSLVPLLVFDPAAILHPRGLLLLGTLPILFVGLFLYAAAGRRREKEQGTLEGPKDEPSGSFIAGLAIAAFTGVFGANLNLGFAFSGGLIQKSMQLGANPATSTYCVWALVLTAGFVPNLIFCAFRLGRNRTWSSFASGEGSRECILAAAMAVLWLGGILLYGIGANLIGKYGTAVGFVLMTSSVLIAANVAGILTGEWKSVSPRTKGLLAGGIASIVVSVVILSLGGLV
jgi:L-rhamnose-H+ transport protein